MNDSFLDRFTSLATHPLSLLTIICLTLMGVFAHRIYVLRWCMLGTLILAASFCKYVDTWTKREGAAFMQPIETFLQSNRGFAVIILAICITITLRYSKMRFRPAALLLPLYFIQSVSVIKYVVQGGQTGFALQLLIIYGLLLYFHTVTLNSWLAMEKDLEGVAIALTAALAGFVFIGELQLWLYSEAALTKGRFFGCTGNPQHAAVYLAICLAGPCYLLLKPDRLRLLPNAARFAVVPLCAASLHLLLLTGSRTGLLMAGITILLGLILNPRGNSTYPIWIGVGLTAVVAAVVLALCFSNLGKSSFSMFNNFVNARGNTRNDVWIAQWKRFEENWVYGVSFAGGRFRSGESSWLAMLEGYGIFGAIALLWLAIRMQIAALSLILLVKKDDDFVLLCDRGLCFSVLFAMFIGSFAEAYLIGVISAPVVILGVVAISIQHVLRRSDAPSTAALERNVGSRGSSSRRMTAAINVTR